MKRFFLLALLLFLTGCTQQADIGVNPRTFTSQQVGENPQSGYILSTNGATSTWIANSGGPGGGGSTTTLTATQVAYGSPDNTVTSSPNFTFNSSTNLLSVISVSSTNVTTTNLLVSGILTPPSGYSIPLTASTTDWQTAFGWGNHALAGYLTSYTETDPIWTSASTSYLRLDGGTMTGGLNFVNATSTGYFISRTTTIQGGFFQTDLPDCNQDTEALMYNSTSGKFECGDDDQGGAAAVSLTNTLIPFGSADNTLTSSTALSYNTSTNHLILTGTVSSTNALFENATSTNFYAFTFGVNSFQLGTLNLQSNGDKFIILNQGGFETQFNTANITGNVSLVIPDQGGTIALTEDLALYLPLTGGSLSGGLSFINATSTGYFVSATTTITGGLFQTGMTDCDADNQTVAYDLATGKFGCGDDDTGAGSQSLTNTLVAFGSADNQITSSSFFSFTTSTGVLSVISVSSTNVTTTNLLVSGAVSLPTNSITDAMVAGTLTLTGGSIDNMAIGASTPSTGIFTSITSTNSAFATTSITGGFFQTGLSTCNADNETLAYNATTGKFECGDDDQGGGSSSLTNTLIAFGSADNTITSSSVFSFNTTTGALIAPSVSSTNVTTTNLLVLGVLSLPASSVTDAMVDGSLTITGGSINNTPIGASTPSTGIFTNATSTNLGVTGLTNLQGLSFTNGTSTNFFAGLLQFTNLNGTNATSSRLFATNALFTNATSTNLNISGLTNLAGTTITNGTSTNFFSGLLQYTNLNGTNATTTNLRASGATSLVNVTSTNFAVTGLTGLQGLTFTNATGTGQLRIATTTITGGFFQTDLANCTGDTETVSYNATTGKFGCGDDDTGGGGSLWTDGGLFTYLTSSTSDVAIGAITTSSAPFWWDVSATTSYIGNGGAGDSSIQLGPDANAWTIGFDDTDDSFTISSSTVLGTSNALSISKTSLITTVENLVVTGDFARSYMRIVTSTGSSAWSKPVTSTGFVGAYVWCVGGGGGGGGAGTDGDVGAGGGGGGAAYRYLSASDLSATSSVNITVGAGGAGGAAGDNDGAAGGTSSFGNFITCTGGGLGNDGLSGGAGGAGGVGSGGNVNGTGRAGTDAGLYTDSYRGYGGAAGANQGDPTAIQDSLSNPMPAAGILGMWAGAGPAKVPNWSAASYTGGNGARFGAGGGGGQRAGGGATAAGGNGAQGVVVIQELYQ